jgi:hypothetical protein
MPECILFEHVPCPDFAKEAAATLAHFPLSMLFVQATGLIDLDC